MSRTRIKLNVYVDLDPLPGAFDSAESAQMHVRAVLRRHLEHYAPEVTVESSDIAKPTQMPPLGALLDGVLDELKEAKDALQIKLDAKEPNFEESELVLSLIDQIAAERSSTVTHWGTNILEVRTEDTEGNVDKKMVDTTEYPEHMRGVTITPGKF